MKVDKDALIKHRFWILLGVYALLWIICLSFMVANAGGPIEERKKDYDAAQGAVAKFPRPKNESFLPPWQKYGATFTKHKNEVWKIAWYGDKPGEVLPSGQQPWKGQGDMYDWPHDQEHPLDKVLLYPDSPFELSLREWYKTQAAYGKEFSDVQRELQSDGTAPVKNKPPSGPLGAVVFRGGYDNVMQPLNFPDRTPDAEECWLAQEDFWVKRELLYVLRDAMSLTAHLDPVPDAAANKEEPSAKDANKYLGRQVFRNASWEVTLLFDKDEKEKGQMRISPDSTIKNVHVSHREQTLGNPAVPIAGVFFRLRQGESGRDFYFTGEKVPWDKERPLGVDNGWLVSSINPKQPVELEQVFDRGNTPIASIDEIRIPYVSNRNANRSLVAAKPERFGKKEAVADATKTPLPGAPPFGMAPGGSAPPGGSIGPVSGGFGQMGGQGGAGPGTGALPSATPNRTLNINLDRDRYLFVTDQSRHLPVAMTLTVDQSHLSEILVAIANSRLRFQTTQVEFRRQPTGASSASGSGLGEAPGGMPGPGGSARFPTAPRPFGAPGATAPAMPALVLVNPNLVEVTVYGIASLYERPREEKK